MCVIAKYTEAYPTKTMLESMEAMNKDGGGMAWIEGDHVRWEKGMHVNTKFIMDKIESEKIQLPIIIHFRIATHGSVDTPLCQWLVDLIKKVYYSIMEYGVIIKKLH